MGIEALKEAQLEALATIWIIIVLFFSWGLLYRLHPLFLRKFGGIKIELKEIKRNIQAFPLNLLWIISGFSIGCAVTWAFLPIFKDKVESFLSFLGIVGGLSLLIFYVLFSLREKFKRAYIYSNITVMLICGSAVIYFIKRGIEFLSPILLSLLFIFLITLYLFFLSFREKEK
jgi:hypothetical protein